MFFCSTHVSHYLQSAEIAIQVEMSTVLFLVSCKNFLLSNTLTLISRSKSIHSLLLQILTVVSGDHWSSWSGWSKCSRTCDGGASYQLRKCLKSYIFRTDCHGDRIRYQTCNNDVSVGSSASLFTPFSAFVVKNREPSWPECLTRHEASPIHYFSKQLMNLPLMMLVK